MTKARVQSFPNTETNSTFYRSYFISSFIATVHFSHMVTMFPVLQDTDVVKLMYRIPQVSTHSIATCLTCFSPLYQTYCAFHPASHSIREQESCLEISTDSHFIDLRHSVLIKICQVQACFIQVFWVHHKI